MRYIFIFTLFSLFCNSCKKNKAGVFLLSKIKGISSGFVQELFYDSSNRIDSCIMYQNGRFLLTSRFIYDNQGRFSENVSNYGGSHSQTFKVLYNSNNKVQKFEGYSVDNNVRTLTGYSIVRYDQNNIVSTHFDNLDNLEGSTRYVMSSDGRNMDSLILYRKDNSISEINVYEDYDDKKSIISFYPYGFELGMSSNNWKTCRKKVASFPEQKYIQNLEYNRNGYLIKSVFNGQSTLFEYIIR
jgi:hypothetical protein